jgi:hypothetical protein
MDKLSQLQNKLLLFDIPQKLENIYGLQNFNRTYTITIQKFSEGIPSTYQIFGYNIGPYEGAQLNPVNVNILQSSVDEVNRDMAANPFTTMFCRYKTNNAANLNYPITYSKQDSTGMLAQKVITPIDYLEPEDRFDSNGLIYIPDFKGLLFDGTYALTGYLVPNSTITLVLSLQNKVRIGAAANGQDVLTKNNTPAPGQIRKIDFITNQQPVQPQKIQIINPLTKNR